MSEEADIPATTSSITTVKVVTINDSIISGIANVRLTEEQDVAYRGALEIDQATKCHSKEEEKRLAKEVERKQKEEPEAREVAEKEDALVKLCEEKALSLGREPEKGLDVTQEIAVKPMEEILVPNTTNLSHNNSSSFERLVRPQKTPALNCPRCNSTRTKFCYYNNYSLSQPRYLCKTCRRYWTANGGALRMVRVGGGSRKNKRSSSSSISSSNSNSLLEKLPDLAIPSPSTSVPSQNTRIIHHDHYGQDLSLGFPSTRTFQIPNFDATRNTNSSLSARELLTRITSRGTVNSLMLNPIPIPDPIWMIPMPEFKIPSDGMESSVGGADGNNSGRLLFPFEERKTNTSTSPDDQQVGQNKDQNGDSNGFWSGMLGGGSW